MARAFDLEGKDRDLVLGAAILHDMVKQGFKQTGHTVKDHAALAAQLVEKVFKTTESKIEKKIMKLLEVVFFIIMVFGHLSRITYQLIVLQHISYVFMYPITRLQNFMPVAQSTIKKIFL